MGAVAARGYGSELEPEELVNSSLTIIPPDPDGAATVVYARQFSVEAHSLDLVCVGDGGRRTRPPA
jgi:hypothetical protein